MTLALPLPRPPPVSRAYIDLSEARLHFVKWRIACGEFNDLDRGKPLVIVPCPRWEDGGIREVIECAG